MPPATREITEMLKAWGAGDPQALDRLMPLVYAELRRVARGYMARERPGHTLQPTALVNEAWVRMAGTRGVDWKDRAHFFAVCARMMRRILVDSARRRNYQKRGGGQTAISLDDSRIPAGPRGDAGLVALDDALKALDKLDPRKSRVVELRFFGGLGVEATAAVLEVSPETVMRDWKMAKAWLHRELGGEKQHGA